MSAVAAPPPDPGSVPPRVPAHQWRLLLPLLLMLLTGAAYLHERSLIVPEDALRLALARQTELAGQFAAGATRAARGDPAAFAELRRMRTRAAAARKRLREQVSARASAGAAQPYDDKLDALDQAWRRMHDAGERLLGAQAAAVSVRDDVEAFQSIATGILVTADELVDAMLAAEEPPEQIRAASRQLLLIQRISANVRRVLEGGDGLITAADRFGRDAVRFGDVNNGLLNGNPGLRISRVRDDAARDILVDIGREFRRGAELIEQVMADAVALARAEAAAADIADAAGNVSALGGEIAKAIAAQRAERTPAAHLTAIFGALALLSLLAIMGHLAAVTRRARIEARSRARALAEANARTQARESALVSREAATENAIRRLIDELDRLSRGEPPKDEDAPEEILRETPLAPLELAVTAVRRRLAALARAAYRVSAAGSRFVEMATGARRAADEQGRQVEKAAAATRVMAAQVESVSDHGHAGGELANQSLASVRRVAAAAESAGAQAEQTLFAAKNTAARIRQLNESTRQIQEIGRIVDELCEQCRMLSLNVSIRASLDESSGSPLAGNLVDEVQKLAADARRALRRIDSVNEDVRAHAGQAADSVKQVLWAAESAAEQNHAAVREASSLLPLAERFNALQRELTEALEEHTLRMTEVVKATSAVHGASNRTRGQMRECAESATRVADLAGLLEATLTGFDDAQVFHGSIIELPALSPAPRPAPPGREKGDNDAASPRQASGQESG